MQGDRQRVMESFARTGDWQRAAQVAAELRDGEKLVRFSLMAAFGRLPKGPIPDTLTAAELLAAQGHSRNAVVLFEQAGAFLRAGEAAQAARDPLRAARCFQQAGAWMPAVRCFEEAGNLREALQTVEEGLRSLERKGETSAAGCRTEDLNLLRADLLLRDGQFSEAVKCYLDLGQIEEASAAASKAPDRDRLRARILLETGRAAEAGDLFAQLGLANQAAEAYEKASDWSRAAYRWEAGGEPGRAAEAYEKAGRLRDAGRCYRLAGMPQRAAEVAGRAHRSGPSKAVVIWGDQKLQTARLSLKSGDKSGAAALLLQIRPEEPGFAESTVLLAPLLIEEGFCQDALDRLRLAPRGQSPEIEIERAYWEGRSLEAMGNTKEAIGSFQRVTASGMSHRDAWERLETLKSRPPAMESACEPEVGSRIADRYEILAELGHGGMGRVYKARDLELGEIVAVKTLLAAARDSAEEERLLREVQICRRITHPNVVRVYDIGRFQGGLFVTMEYVEGECLDRIIELESPLPFARIRFLLMEMAAGLHEAHSQGIVHRDLKPANVLVTASRLKILDFGIASMAGLGARLTQCGVVMGTPMYMSPDQILGREPDSRSDLYSLGLLAYTLITSREPYDSSDITALLMKQLKILPTSVRRLRPETPEPWVAMLDRLLAKDPEDRFQSARELLDALAKLPA